MASQDSSHEERVQDAKNDIERAAESISLIKAKWLTWQERIELGEVYEQLEDEIESRISRPDDCSERGWDCILQGLKIR